MLRRWSCHRSVPLQSPLRIVMQRVSGVCALLPLTGGASGSGRGMHRETVGARPTSVSRRQLLAAAARLARDLLLVCAPCAPPSAILVRRERAPFPCLHST